MSGRVHFDNVDSATTLVRTADKRVGQLFMDFANLGIPEEDFVKRSKELVDAMADIRKMERLDLEQNNRQLASLFGTALHDELGLPTPPPDPPGRHE